MPSIPRRRILTAAAGGVVFLAGCLGSEEHSDTAPGPDANETAVDADFVSVRSATEPVLFNAEDEPDRTQNERQKRHSSDFLATEADVDSIEFASTESGTELASFVEETDFETESVMLYSTAVTDCHEIHLVAATLDGDDTDPHLDFCRSTRPADVSCDDDTLHTVAYAVRFPIDGREVSSHGSGMSSSCRDHPWPDTFRKTVTVQTEAEE